MKDALTARIFECGCPDAVSQNDSQIVPLPVDTVGIFDTSGGQYVLDQDSRIGKFQPSPNCSQSADVCDLESEMQRPIPESTALPPGYADVVRINMDGTSNSHFTS